MAGSLRDRLICAGWVLVRMPLVRPVGLAGGLISAFSWYGLGRRKLARKAVVSQLNEDFLWVDIGAFGLAWPVGAPLDRLFMAMVELRSPTNPHYYFHRLTPVPRGGVVLDIGACEGSFALECLTNYGAGQVFCFEPDSRMVGAIRTAAEKNGLEDCLHTVPAAVSDAPGRLLFLEDAANPLRSRIVESADALVEAETAQNVEVLTIDAWAHISGIERVDYIKIDAEGSDLAVLKGAEGTLRCFRPSIAVTTYHLPGHCEEITDFILSLDAGYIVHAKGVVAENGIPRPVMLHAAAKGV
ncbi:MAG: FkbM family methyltransferase [Armatimonadota bacterium]